MAPCVIVERLEGKQQCSRASVGEHAEVQAKDAECGCHEQQEVNEKQPNPRNSPSHNHDSTAPRQYPLIYTGAGPIHPVHGPLLSPCNDFSRQTILSLSACNSILLVSMSLSRKVRVCVYTDK